MDSENLTEKEKTLLIACLEKHNPELLKQLDQLFLKQLDNNIVNEMRSAVGNEMGGYHAFNENGKITAYGWEIENLIDRLARLYWREKY